MTLQEWKTFENKHGMAGMYDLVNVIDVENPYIISQCRRYEIYGNEKVMRSRTIIDGNGDRIHYVYIQQNWGLY